MIRAATSARAATHSCVEVVDRRQLLAAQLEVEDIEVSSETTLEAYGRDIPEA